MIRLLLLFAILLLPAACQQWTGKKGVATNLYLTTAILKVEPASPTLPESRTFLVLDNGIKLIPLNWESMAESLSPDLESYLKDPKKGEYRVQIAYKEAASGQASTQVAGEKAIVLNQIAMLEE
ncbi:hypothetical protein [Hugenholtzia roseola]|uniref:hypothetical protein n=1 Tax=Hugenholtzia roseola TaxID=1002 RepID=UPI0012B654C8|nr:hypothetical protein [Hugenholtzia roseola]